MGYDPMLHAYMASVLPTTLQEGSERTFYLLVLNKSETLPEQVYKPEFDEIWTALPGGKFCELLLHQSWDMKRDQEASGCL